MAKISIVTPTRDRDDLISETIESVIKQTEKDWQMIIVDDHSSAEDETEKVIKSFADERVLYFKLTDENGKGIAAARNFGIMLAETELLTFLDSDDICYPERIELTLKAFSEKKPDLTYGNLKRWDPQTNEETNQLPQFQPGEFDFKRFSEVDYIPMGTVTTKRSILLEYPFNSFFRRAEDYDLLMRLAKRGYKFHYIDHPLIKYRRHEGSITKEKKMLFNYGRMVKNNYQVVKDE